jgi:hypothetical protein
MELASYQQIAWQYDQQGADHQRGLAVSLLGLGGEVGSLQTSQKKRIRDGVTPSSAREIDEEDIGDILWYLSVTATRMGVNFDAAATNNLAKISGRWPENVVDYPDMSSVVPAGPSRSLSRADQPLGAATVFDSSHESNHRLPRKFRIILAPDDELGKGRVRMVWDGRKFGDPLSDNSAEDDWYRFHDAFHLAYAAVLGWSPVFRLLGGLKRKDVPEVDEVQDGGRAIAIEEGIAAFLFEDGRRNDWFQHGQAVPGEALSLCRRMTSQLEAAVVTAREWERAIQVGFACWRVLVDRQQGVLVGDLDARTLEVETLSAKDRTEHAAVCRSEVQARATKTTG